MTIRLRRALGVTLAPVLALGGLATFATGSASAATPDPVAPAAAGDWLAGELTDGLVHNTQYDFDDYGLSIDVALGLAALGGHVGDVQAISDAIAANIDFYTGYDYFPAPESGEPRHITAGSFAKALVLAQTAGDDPTDFGGTDLVADLEDQVIGSGAVGRIADTFNPDVQFEADFANTVGQAFAAQGLSAAGSADAAAVTGFLIDQQCDAGYFRLNFAPDSTAAEQGCVDDAAGSEPDTDATALAVLSLSTIETPSAEVTDAIDDAKAWLISTQGANGSYGGGTSTEAPNANSTGLAGWALGELGEDAAAEKAAIWVRGLQANDCVGGLQSQTGAIAYDPAARAGGVSDGIVTQTEDQFRRASAQSAPVLQWAPATGVGATTATPLPKFVRAGSVVRLGASGIAPGAMTCFTSGAVKTQAVAGANGQALVAWKVRAGNGAQVVSTQGTPATYRIQALAAKKLRLDKRAKVKAGKKQVVVTKGLAVGERVTVKYRNKVVARGTANAKGRFAARFSVGRKVGNGKIVAIGQFTDRRGSTSFRIVR